jgi:hypothetical protein
MSSLNHCPEKGKTIKNKTKKQGIKFLGYKIMIKNNNKQCYLIGYHFLNQVLFTPTGESFVGCKSSPFMWRYDGYNMLLEMIRSNMT